MIRKSIAIIDYGVGNHASIQQTFRSIGHKCVVSRDAEVLSRNDMLVLPGVGAYPAAMSALNKSSLVDCIRQLAASGKPILGLCLGMQLLAERSNEGGNTAGLGLVPGYVVQMAPNFVHIGWNTIEVARDERLLSPSDGEDFYFNHSNVLVTPNEYQICRFERKQKFTAAVRIGNIVGCQFHPEKSQVAGKKLLKSLVEGLTDA
ncbi:imidazole glycerol phosphate synthase subunit HisH [Lentilitoribacter sp. EG35]|uniref:imidazole glycerol phosphate synthase subunit HisH n=1 Tax=Lentilitoribacter sp. EG35 TaxID=3234192 RepID=UPI00345F7029